MFGAVNALFTALAFAGLIYTVLLQRDQLALQQREINESGEIQRKLVQDQIEAQRQLFEQRKVHDLKMEDLRERFYELTEKLRREREVAEENEFKANVLRAIRCELDVLGTIYNQGIGAQFAEVKENQPFLLRLGLTEDWFTVFTANARYLGKLDGETSPRIVTVYTLLKRLIEEYRINNDYIAQWRELELQLMIEPKSVYFLESRKQLRDWMVLQVAQMKKAEKIMKLAVQNLLNLLDSRGIK